MSMDQVPTNFIIEFTQGRR